MGARHKMAAKRAWHRTNGCCVACASEAQPGQMRFKQEEPCVHRGLLCRGYLLKYFVGSVEGSGTLCPIALAFKMHCIGGREVLPSDAAWSRQFPSPVVAKGSNRWQLGSTLAHQFRRPGQKGEETGSSYFVLFEVLGIFKPSLSLSTSLAPTSATVH